uniref:Uncharacterized protein n=1 Tax=Rhizophora mucronata TaxID=61149 RepID=A0A2P2PFM4_RHIMU
MKQRLCGAVARELLGHIFYLCLTLIMAFLFCSNFPSICGTGCFLRFSSMTGPKTGSQFFRSNWLVWSRSSLVFKTFVKEVLHQLLSTCYRK